MKKTLLLCAIVFVCSVQGHTTAGTQGYVLETMQEPYHLLRPQADEDPNTTIGSTAVTLTTGSDFASKPTNAVELVPPTNADGHRANSIEIITAAGSAASKTYTVTYYGWRHANGVARRIAAVAYTTGSATMVNYPRVNETIGATLQSYSGTATDLFWADTATITDYWHKTVRSSDAAGNNGIAGVHVDFSGYRWVYGVVTGADGATGAEAGDVIIYYSWL